MTTRWVRRDRGEVLLQRVRELSIITMSSGYDWIKENDERGRVVRRHSGLTFNLKRRAEVLRHYGGKCACCGESDFHFLTIDHINGEVPNSHYSADGKRKYGPALINQIVTDGFPDKGIRLLCWNCNSTIGVLGFCPHNPPDNAPLRFTPDGHPIIPELPNRRKRINPKTHCNQGHSLEDAYVRQNGWRQCKECHRLRMATRTKGNGWRAQAQPKEKESS